MCCLYIKCNVQIKGSNPHTAGLNSWSGWWHIWSFDSKSYLIFLILKTQSSSITIQFVPQFWNFWLKLPAGIIAFSWGSPFCLKGMTPADLISRECRPYHKLWRRGHGARAIINFVPSLGKIYPQKYPWLGKNFQKLHEGNKLYASWLIMYKSSLRMFCCKAFPIRTTIPWRTTILCKENMLGCHTDTNWMLEDRNIFEAVMRIDATSSFCIFLD